LPIELTEVAEETDQLGDAGKDWTWG
jgi:hypothetical protein